MNMQEAKKQEHKDAIQEDIETAIWNVENGCGTEDDYRLLRFFNIDYDEKNDGQN